MRPPKQSLGVRVNVEVQTALKRVSGAQGISINQLAERILATWLSKQHEDPVADWESVEQWIGEQFARGQRNLEASEKRLEKSLSAVRAMIDAHVLACSPDKHGAYVDTVKKTMAAMNIFQHANGVIVK